MLFPKGIMVGFTDTKIGSYVRLNGIQMTPAEARRVAQELLLLADFQERTPDTKLVNGYPCRIIQNE